LAGLLLIAALRGASLPRSQRLPGWQTGGGPTTLIPDLAHDDGQRLGWLPVVGSFRARQIIEQRPFLQVPLTPERLALLPGVGETTAAEVAAWYAGLVEEVGPGEALE
jgi:hypothetical protein